MLQKLATGCIDEEGCEQLRQEAQLQAALAKAYGVSEEDNGNGSASVRLRGKATSHARSTPVPPNGRNGPPHPNITSQRAAAAAGNRSLAGAAGQEKELPPTGGVALGPDSLLPAAWRAIVEKVMENHTISEGFR
jgi:hypothetical protein